VVKENLVIYFEGKEMHLFTSAGQQSRVKMYCGLDTRTDVNEFNIL